MMFSIEQFYNECSIPELLIEVMQNATINDNSNIMSSTKALRFSMYGIAGSIYLFLQTLMIILYNLYTFWPIRKINTSYLCILKTLFISNVMFSITCTTPFAFMVLIKKWYLGEVVCLLFKYLQTFTLQYSSIVTIYISFFNLSPNIIKTKICVALFALSSFFCSMFEVSI